MYVVPASKFHAFSVDPVNFELAIAVSGIGKMENEGVTWENSNFRFHNALFPRVSNLRKMDWDMKYKTAISSSFISA